MDKCHPVNLLQAEDNDWSTLPIIFLWWINAPIPIFFWSQRCLGQESRHSTGRADLNSVSQPFAIFGSVTLWACGPPFLRLIVSAVSKFCILYSSVCSLLSVCFVFILVLVSLSCVFFLYVSKPVFVLCVFVFCFFILFVLLFLFVCLLGQLPSRRPPRQSVCTETECTCLVNFSAQLRYRSVHSVVSTLTETFTLGTGRHIFFLKSKHFGVNSMKCMQSLCEL